MRVENLPRFHEDWSGKTCTMAGSLVNTWNSQYATSAWNIGGDFYNPPARVWTYDTAFNSVANGPGLMPLAVMGFLLPFVAAEGFGSFADGADRHGDAPAHVTGIALTD